MNNFATSPAVWANRPDISIKKLWYMNVYIRKALKEFEKTLTTLHYLGAIVLMSESLMALTSGNSGIKYNN